MGSGPAGPITEVVLMRGGDASVLASGAVKVNDVSGGGGVTSAVVSLSTLDTDYTAASSAEHTNISTAAYRKFTLAGNVSKTGTPTDILLEARFATNSTTSAKFQYQNGFWGDVRWDDTAIGASGFDFALSGDVQSDFMSVFATMTGNNTVTLADMTIFLKD